MPARLEDHSPAESLSPEITTIGIRQYQNEVLYTHKLTTPHQRIRYPKNVQRLTTNGGESIARMTRRTFFNSIPTIHVTTTKIKQWRGETKSSTTRDRSKKVQEQQHHHEHHPPEKGSYLYASHHCPLPPVATNTNPALRAHGTFQGILRTCARCPTQH